MSAKDAIVKVGNDTYTLLEASRVFQIPWSTIRQRYYKRERGEKLVRPAKHIIVTMNGKKHTLGELSLRYRLNSGTVKSRYYAGKRGKELIRPSHTSSHHHYETSKNRTITFYGRPRTFQSVSDEYGIEVRTIRGRYYRGDRDADLVRPLGQSIRTSRSPIHVIVNGERKTFKELGHSYGISVNIIKDRYYQGKQGRDLVRPPKKHFG